MPNPRIPGALKLAALHPVLLHDSHGHHTGVSFLCPTCDPPGVCERTLVWGIAPPKEGESFGKVNTLSSRLSVPTGTAKACEGLLKIQDGKVIPTFE